jgi:hypothetical protein
MINVINPLHTLKLAYKIALEISDYFFNFIPEINRLHKEGELERLGIRIDFIRQLAFVINMPTDILFVDTSTQDLYEFETNIITQTMEKRGYSPYFTRQGLLDSIRIRKKERIKNNVYYAYLIKMWYKFEYLAMSSILKIIASVTLYYFLIDFMVSSEYVHELINQISSILNQ